ncbi:MAG: hypothetical protein WC343_11835 [Bacilli bacterium]|jgi:hypothetical protein
METVITIVFVALGILLLEIAVKRETYDFWLGIGAASVLYFVTDLMTDAIPLRHFWGFDFPLFFGALALFAGAKMAMMKRDRLQDVKADEVEE